MAVRERNEVAGVSNRTDVYTAYTVYGEGDGEKKGQLEWCPEAPSSPQRGVGEGPCFRESQGYGTQGEWGRVGGVSAGLWVGGMAAVPL